MTLPYCWVHAKKLYGIRVKPSSIKDGGNGLFMMRDTPRWTWIAPIIGEPVSPKEMHRRYGAETAPYGVAESNRLWYDGACWRFAGHNANSATSVADLNARIEYRGDSPYRLWIRATRRIPAGAEVFVDYGPDYELTGKSFVNRVYEI